MDNETRKHIKITATLLIVGGALIGVGHALGRWPS
jgi:hypothetical protein